jgi:hypothetical protein
MDINTTLVSSAITTCMYILYKVAQRYYLSSKCTDNTLEIVITDKEQTLEIVKPEIKNVVVDKDAI